MVVAYIMLGIASGIIAAIATLVAGGGVLLAFGAYVLGGMAGMVAGILWTLMPGRMATATSGTPQRG